MNIPYKCTDCGSKWKQDDNEPILCPICSKKDKTKVDRDFKVTIYAAGSGKKINLFVKPSRLVKVLAELSVYYDEFEIE